MQPHKASALIVLVVTLALLPGCQGTSTQTSTNPSAIADNPLLAPLMGPGPGRFGGRLIGAAPDRVAPNSQDKQLAHQAMVEARFRPATLDDVRRATTADLNHDGFVTTDEIVAMSAAGLDNKQIVDRLRATGQVFELSPLQKAYLRRRGVSRYVLEQIPHINRTTHDRLLRHSPQPLGGRIISTQPATAP